MASQDGGAQGELALRPEILFDRFDELLDACREPLSVADTVLDASIALHGAQFGMVQLLDRNARDLILVTQRGFDPEFLSAYGVAAAGTDAASRRALRDGGSILITDVDAEHGFISHRGLAAKA